MPAVKSVPPSNGRVPPSAGLRLSIAFTKLTGSVNTPRLLAVDEKPIRRIETLPLELPNSSKPASRTALSIVFSSVLSMLPEKSITNAALKSSVASVVEPESAVVVGPSSLNVNCWPMLIVACALSPSPSVIVPVTVMRLAAKSDFASSCCAGVLPSTSCAIARI